MKKEAHIFLGLSAVLISYLSHFNASNHYTVLSGHSNGMSLFVVFHFFFYFLISWSLSQKCGKDEQLFFRVSSFSFYFSHIANQEKIEYIHLLKKEYNLINFHIFSLLLLHSFIAILDKETDYQVYQVLRWTEIS